MNADVDRANRGNRVSRNRLLSRALLVLAISLSVTAVGKAQTTYTYTVIADLANCFNFSSPAINNHGEVVFGGNCGTPIGPGIVIRRGNGGALTPIYTFTSTDSTPPHTDVLSINDSGVVAFAVRGPCPNAGGSAILKGDGGPVDVVHDICTTPGFTSVIRPSINNAGAVAFMAASGSSYDTVPRVSGGTTVTIAGPGTVTTSVGTLTFATEPSINNNGVVTFTGHGAVNFGLFTGVGGAPTTISLDGPSTFNSIDDSGRVAFVSNNSLVQTGDGGPVVTIAATTPTGYQGFPGSGASISASGKVAFMASLPSGVWGVFTGPDPDVHAVLKTGDVILGFGTVTGVSIMREAINDSGQVAMAVIFNDAGVTKAAIIRADPPNSPPTAFDGSASVTAGGSVSGTLSASDPDGEPITHTIANNGSKGTAMIGDAATGAFTYTASAGTSGNDTFTFQATDIRGLASNVATITVAIESPPACAVDVTSSISPAKGKGAKNTSTTQALTFTNSSATAIAGPISLVLDSLGPAGTTLTNAAGVTVCATPTGNPYVNLNVGADSMWSPGERVEVILEFALESSARGRKPEITYTWRAVAGPGVR